MKPDLTECTALFGQAYRALTEFSEKTFEILDPRIKNLEAQTNLTFGQRRLLRELKAIICNVDEAELMLGSVDPDEWSDLD